MHNWMHGLDWKRIVLFWWLSDILLLFCHVNRLFFRSSGVWDALYRSIRPTVGFRNMGGLTEAEYCNSSFWELAVAPEQSAVFSQYQCLVQWRMGWIQEEVLQLWGEIDGPLQIWVIIWEAAVERVEAIASQGWWPAWRKQGSHLQGGWLDTRNLVRVQRAAGHQSESHRSHLPSWLLPVLPEVGGCKGLIIQDGMY